MSVACACSKARHACSPRRPGSDSSVSRPKRAATSPGGESFCICNQLALGYLQSQVYPACEEDRLMTEVQPDLGRTLSRRFAATAQDARVTRTSAAIEANGITVLRAPDSAEAKRIVLDLTHAGSQSPGDARAQAAYGVHSGVFSSSLASGHPTASPSSPARKRPGPGNASISP